MCGRKTVEIKSRVCWLPNPFCGRITLHIVCACILCSQQHRRRFQEFQEPKRICRDRKRETASRGGCSFNKHYKFTMVQSPVHVIQLVVSKDMQWLLFYLFDLFISEFSLYNCYSPPWRYIYQLAVLSSKKYFFMFDPMFPYHERDNRASYLPMFLHFLMSGPHYVNKIISIRRSKTLP